VKPLPRTNNYDAISTAGFAFSNADSGDSWDRDGVTENHFFISYTVQGNSGAKIEIISFPNASFLLYKDLSFRHIKRLCIIHSGQKVGGGTSIFS